MTKRIAIIFTILITLCMINLTGCGKKTVEQLSNDNGIVIDVDGIFASPRSTDVAAPNALQICRKAVAAAGGNQKVPSEIKVGGKEP